MKKNSTQFSLLIFLLCLFGAAPLFAQSLDASKITESLLLEMDAAPDAYHRAYVLLSDRIHVREMEADFRLRIEWIREILLNSKTGDNIVYFQRFTQLNCSQIWLI